MNKYSLYKHVNVVSGNVHREVIVTGKAKKHPADVRNRLDEIWDNDLSDDTKWVLEANQNSELMGYKTYRYVGEI